MSGHRTRVWDLPTRLFHWVLGAAVAALFVTGKTGGNAMLWHGRIGLLVLALLLFRLVWGWVGGHWSRFSSFIQRPAALLRHLQGRSPAAHRVGHNPLGALSVLAMLLLLAAQVGSGLFSDDEIAFSGPLVSWVSGEAVAAATRWHKGWGQWLLLATLGLHLAAIALYEIRGQRLVAAMVSGDKQLPEIQPQSRDDGRTRALALLVFALALGVAAWVASRGAV